MNLSKTPWIARILLMTLILMGMATRASAGMVPDLVVMMKEDVDTASPHAIDAALLKRLELIAGVPLTFVGQTRSQIAYGC